MITGAILPEEEATSLLNCIERGENDYKNYRQSRLIDKTRSLFDLISFKKNKTKNKRKKKIIDMTKVHAEFTRTIDIARVRGYSVRNLLSYELTTPSHFRTTKEGFLTKSAKSELLEFVRKQQILESNFTPSSNERAIIVDFMAEARKMES